MLRCVLSHQRIRWFTTATTNNINKNKLSSSDIMEKFFKVPEALKDKALADITANNIRNFSIIAHIDHGKSTLSDSLLVQTGSISQELASRKAQVLDSLEVERQRGITVKAQSASMFYGVQPNTGSPTSKDVYLLNLVDTPGHVDFSYEVSRSLAACQGALLLVDASQGIQAQTLANLQLARAAGLDILPIVTKVDLPTAQPAVVAQEMISVFGVDEKDIIYCSAKSGEGIKQILPAVISRIKPPTGEVGGALRALLFDSWFDPHRGVICLLSIKDGTLTKGDTIHGYHGGGLFEVQEVGLLQPAHRPCTRLSQGQVGYMIAGIKNSRDVRLGDTFIRVGEEGGGAGDRDRELERNAGRAFRRSASSSRQALTLLEKKKQGMEPLPGFQPAKSMVFAGLFPAQLSAFTDLQKAIEKLSLNDASVQVEPESSEALGLGYRVGFLGLLHMDVFTTRLKQEFHQDTILTAPTVPYTVELKSGVVVKVESPSKFPLDADIQRCLEPMVVAVIMCPLTMVGLIRELGTQHRGVVLEHKPISNERVVLRYSFPMSEIITQFYDKLKSISQGFASLEYEIAEPQEADLVVMQIALNGQEVDALSAIVPRERATDLGRRYVAKLKDVIDRQNFEIIIQARTGKKVLARERIAPFRKDVLTKSGKTVGGGDESRKKKLLEKQKEGKKQMKTVGNVELSQEAFLSILQT